jgi:hypothetical protein
VDNRRKYAFWPWLSLWRCGAEPSAGGPPHPEGVRSTQLDVEAERPPIDPDCKPEPPRVVDDHTGGRDAVVVVADMTMRAVLHGKLTIAQGERM